MNYFIYGTENFAIELETKKLIKKHQTKAIILDENSKLEQQLLELKTVSIFAQQPKLIVFKNIEALTNQTSARAIVATLKKTNFQANLIFTYDDFIVKNKNSLVDFLLKNAKTISKNKLNKSQQIAAIKQFVANKGGKIDSQIALALAIKLPNNLWIINNEIDKLLLQAKEITLAMVEVAVAKYPSQDNFGFINAFADQKPSAIIANYQKRIFAGDNPLLIINKISNLLIQAKDVATLKILKWDSSTIAKTMATNIYKIEQIKQFLTKIPIQKINNYITFLSDLELKIKLGQLDSKIALEYFLLKWIK